MSTDPPPQSDSRSASVDDDEQAGMEMMKGLLREEESARLQADGMNARRESVGGVRDSLVASWIPGGVGSSVVQRGTMRSLVLDAVDAGICTEAEGKVLFDL